MKIPYDCPRGRDDCIALSNIIAHDESSFFCCGQNNGQSRTVEQDKYTMCFKGEHRDEMSHNDKRDLIHMSSVALQAIALIQADVSDERDFCVWTDLDN